MMSEKYRRMEADHHHKSRYGRVKFAAALGLFLVAFAGMVSCSIRLGLTGTVL